MKYVEAVQPLKNLERPVIFLAGGITNCEDWQHKVLSELSTVNFKKGTVLNPRRENFPINDPGAAREQIMWEHEALWMADVVSFWFAGGESVQPIVMFELGCHLGRYCAGAGPRILVGVDPSYKRRSDVYIQLEAHNQALQGSWKIFPCDSLKKHIDNIKAVFLE